MNATRSMYLAIAMLLQLPVTGCASSPYAAADNLRLTEQEQSERRVLSDRERAEIRAAFISLLGEYEPVAVPAPAEHAMRWSDVQLAAYYACMDVEMAIMRTHRSSKDNLEHFRFELRSASERVGELIVQQVHDHRVYTAHATIGLFKDDEDTAQRLLAAFDRRLRNLGGKRAFAD